ncbi:MAG: hypothetical protein WDN48_07895 [Pseudolabrys sp.]
MSKFAIDLTAEEGRLLDIIELDQGKVTHDNYEKNASAVLSLMKLLGQREAFPELLDRPKYHLGRIKSSHKGLFERNGCTGTEIYKHPALSFLSLLFFIWRELA